jgi:hypothetical protein
MMMYTRASEGAACICDHERVDGKHENKKRQETWKEWVLKKVEKTEQTITKLSIAPMTKK